MRVQAEDLRLVADYLDGYDPEAQEAGRVAAVAAWLRAEAARRETEAVVRSVQRQTGAPAKVIRERMRKD